MTAGLPALVEQRVNELGTDLDRYVRSTPTDGTNAPGAPYRGFLALRAQLGPAVLRDPVAVGLLWESLWQWGAFRNSGVLRSNGRPAFDEYLADVRGGVADAWDESLAAVVSEPDRWPVFAKRIAELHVRTIGIKPFGSQIVAASVFLHHVLPGAVVSLDDTASARFFDTPSVPKGGEEVAVFLRVAYEGFLAICEAAGPSRLAEVSDFEGNQTSVCRVIEVGMAAYVLEHLPEGATWEPCVTVTRAVR